MWIPQHFDPSANYSLQHGNHVAAAPHARIEVSSELHEWSSLIGIVTAIIGNVLISFALNIQRYAHIRISREYHEANMPSTGGGRKAANGATMQEQIAEERAKINAEAPGPGKVDSDGAQRRHHLQGYRDQDAHETSPLLKTYDSGSTITTLEKHSEIEDQRKSYLRSPYWWVGIVLMTIGEAGNFLAYGFAPASIVSPLGVVALVSNCIIAPFMLKERFRMRDGWGVLIAIAGAVTVVLSAKTSETKLGQDELWDAIMRWEFLTYVGITTGVILVLMFVSPRYGDRTILIDLGLVGLFGGYTALSTKGVASLLSDTLWMALTFPITYFLVLILVLSALMQIRYVNHALQRFDSTQVIPVQFVLFTLSVIIGSAVLYRDFESATAARTAKFVGGCLLTFFGVYLITSGRREEVDEEDGDSTDEEEGIRLVDDEVDYQGPRRLTRLETEDSNLSPKRASNRPRTPDRTYSDSATVTPSSNPQTPYTPTPFAFPSTTNSNFPESSHETETYPPHLQRTPNSSAQPSPFTRAQSGPPQTPTFARLRLTQSHQQSPTTPTTPHPYLRSPSTPTTADSFRTPATTTFLPSRSRPSSPNNRSGAAETALRAHLSPSTGRGEPTPPLIRSARRSSFSRLLPGPLISPLSSSLSAVIAESLRRGEGMGAVSGGSVGNRTGQSRGRLSGVRKKGSSKRPAVVGMASDGRVAGATAAAAAGPGGQESLLSGIEESEPAGEVTDVLLAGEGSIETKKAKLQDMSDNLSGLVGRRRGGGKMHSASASFSPSPAPSSSSASSTRRRHRDDDDAKDGAPAEAPL